MPAANLSAPQPCGARAARYSGPKGFDLVVMRRGQASVPNPLRPLTPEVTQVLQVAIGGKLATAYGPDLTALRRGTAPNALEAQLGAPIRWEPSLPDLPDPLAIVAEDGTPLASLAFRECVAPPAVRAPPVAARGSKPDPKGTAKAETKGRDQRCRQGSGHGSRQGNGPRRGGRIRPGHPQAGPAEGCRSEGAARLPASAGRHRRLEHFQARWMPARVKKMRPHNKIERFP